MEQLTGFSEANKAYVEVALELGERALRAALDEAKVRPEEVDIGTLVTPFCAASPSAANKSYQIRPGIDQITVTQTVEPS
ncbi:hypothetical protein [Mycobacterium tilburgii]|uniref:hypothetical protein n=1 Tax=Mycobacterium tilburgii TaxID=44467 RepID=UPI001182F588|nr:hypothetical protein [Mycobacterium tilburgii]